MPAVVVLDGLLLGAPRHHVVVELAPLVRGGEQRRRRCEEDGGRDKLQSRFQLEVDSLPI